MILLYIIPGDILHNTGVVYIPLDGIGYCLNTAYASTVAMYEAIRQYKEQK